MTDESTITANDETTAPAPSDLASSTPTAGEASRIALFGVFLVIIILVVGGGVWWYISRSGVAAEFAVGNKLKELGAELHPLKEGQSVMTIHLPLREADADLDAIVDLLPAFGSIETLSARESALTDEHLETIGRLSSLTSLILTNSESITDKGMPHLTDLDNLVMLEVYGTQVTDAGLEPIGKIESLKTLNIGKTKVTGDMSGLLPLKNLEWLVAGDMALSDEIVDTLAKLPKLSHLQIQNVTISDEAVAKIREAKQGIQIDLR